MLPIFFDTASAGSDFSPSETSKSKVLGRSEQNCNTSPFPSLQLMARMSQLRTKNHSSTAEAPVKSRSRLLILPSPVHAIATCWSPPAPESHVLGKRGVLVHSDSEVHCNWTLYDAKGSHCSECSYLLTRKLTPADRGPGASLPRAPCSLHVGCVPGSPTC